MISLAQLQQICGSTRSQIAANYPALCGALEFGDIMTPRRMAAYIGQIAHETGGFRWLEELASGEAYEGRKNLGNIAAGDGKKYKGRGHMHLTGRANYTTFSMETLRDMTFVKFPEMLLEPVHAAASGVWYWNSRKLSALADNADVLAISTKVNGGTNGLAQRFEITKRAFVVLGVQV